MGLKGRFEEAKKHDDHRLKDATYPVSELTGDRITIHEAPALPSLNERLRDDYIVDCQRGVDRWNQIIKRHGIDLETVQKYLNFHYSVSLDLFGSEVSTNAANFYTMGLKGRFEEAKKHDDHRLKDATYPLSELTGDRITTHEAPALPSLNERLRDDYIVDCQRGVDRWNQIIKRHGIDVELRLPHRGFHRAIGLFAEVKVSPDGRVLSEAGWDARKHEWLPTEADQAYVESLMQPVTERGRFASWIAPPARGVNGQPVYFEYVRLA